MQTFLPFPSFSESARVLDYRRLGKQRVEAKQIYLALTDPNYGWQNHPAVKMWRGHKSSLLLYGYVICNEWKSRGYKDSLQPWFGEEMDKLSLEDTLKDVPSWLGNPAFHQSHRAVLYSKNRLHYMNFKPDFEVTQEYVWPVS